MALERVVGKRNELTDKTAFKNTKTIADQGQETRYVPEIISTMPDVTQPKTRDQTQIDSLVFPELINVPSSTGAGAYTPRPRRQIIEKWVLFASLFRLHKPLNLPVKANYKPDIKINRRLFTSRLKHWGNKSFQSLSNGAHEV